MTTQVKKSTIYQENCQQKSLIHYAFQGTGVDLASAAYRKNITNDGIAAIQNLMRHLYIYEDTLLSELKNLLQMHPAPFDAKLKRSNVQLVDLFTLYGWTHMNRWMTLMKFTSLSTAK